MGIKDYEAWRKAQAVGAGGESGVTPGAGARVRICYAGAGHVRRRGLADGGELTAGGRM